MTGSGPQKLLHFRNGAGTIGFDGMGAIDYGASTVDRIPRRFMERIPEFTRTVLTPDSDPTIVLRRGVKIFDLLLNQADVALLVRPEIAALAGDMIARSTTGLTEVTCHFGKRIRPYLFGSLVVNDAIHLVDWPSSRFHIANSSNFTINQTKIDEGCVPPDHEIDYVEENVTIASRRDVFSVAGVFESAVPVRVSLFCDPVDIIHFGVSHTLISQRLYDLIRAQDRPKYRVSGVNASWPLTDVTFLGAA